MRDYKLRKKVFNEYPTTAEVQNMIAQGGGGSGETRTPMFEIDLTGSDDGDNITSYGEVALRLGSHSLALDAYLDGCKLVYTDFFVDESLVTFVWASNEDPDTGDVTQVDLEIDSGRHTITLRGPAGHLAFFVTENSAIGISGTYYNDNRISVGVSWSQIKALFALIEDKIIPAKSMYLTVTGMYSNYSIYAMGPISASCYKHNVTSQIMNEFSAAIKLHGSDVSFTINNDGSIVGSIASIPDS